MSNPNGFSQLYFILTLGVAMTLRVMSVNPTLDVINPDWILLVIVYWAIALPERFGVFTACFAGLLTDVLTGRMLGQYALIYSVVAYFSIKEHRRFRQFPILQQSLFVFYFLLFSKIIVFGLESFKAGNRLEIDFWYPVVSGVIAWPLVFWVLRHLRIVARIA